MPARIWNEPSLELHVNIRNEWIWELRDHDLHVVNRSDNGFATRQACILNANHHGFTLGSVASPRGHSAKEA